MNNLTDFQIDPRYTFLIGAIIGALIVLFLFRWITEVLGYPDNRDRRRRRRRHHRNRRDYDDEDYDDDNYDRSRSPFMGFLAFLILSAVVVWMIQKSSVDHKKPVLKENPIENRQTNGDKAAPKFSPADQDKINARDSASKKAPNDIWKRDENYMKEKSRRSDF